MCDTTLKDELDSFIKIGEKIKKLEPLFSTKLEIDVFSVFNKPTRIFHAYYVSWEDDIIHDHSTYGSEW